MPSVASVVPLPAPQLPRLWRRAAEWLSTPLTRRSVVPVALALVVVFGVVDRLSGEFLPFTLLYVVPIALAAWYRGKAFGVAVALLATAAVGVTFADEYAWSFAFVWNLATALLLFVAVGTALDRLHAYVERERAERRLAVDQLRHSGRLNIIGTLAAGVAHELGTPLNVIAGCAEILAEGSADDHIHKRTAMILDQVARVSAVIRHLLDFGQRGGVARGDVEIGAVARSTVQMLQSTARKHGVSLALEVDAPAHVTANLAELEQVLSYLILNGVQAMSSGTLTVRTRSEKRGRHGVACIDVIDLGHGIPAADLPKIFDPFFTTKDVGEGTGLGLSVSYGIIHDHGGSIEVASEVGRGSRFTIVLPQPI